MDLASRCTKAIDLEPFFLAIFSSVRFSPEKSPDVVFATLWLSPKPSTLKLGYCPHPVTVYIRGPIKGYI